MRTRAGMGTEEAQETHLLNRVWPVETPSPVHVGLSDLVASLTTATFRLDTAVARPTVAVLPLLVEFVQVILEVGDSRMVDGLAILAEAGLEDIVCDVGLCLSRDVHDVKTEDWSEERALACVVESPRLDNIVGTEEYRAP